MINYEPAMIMSWDAFITRLSKGDTKEFIKELEAIRIKLRDVSGYQYDNNICRFSNIYGDEFAFMIYESHKYDAKLIKTVGLGTFHLAVWNQTGGISIYDSPIFKTVETIKAFLPELKRLTERWSYGETQCYACKKMIKYYDNLGHKYFAGVYCEECWNGGYKEIAEKENYE